MSGNAGVVKADAATKKSYKGGWLDKDLRRANGRVGFSNKPKPWAPGPVWDAPPEAAVKDGWVTSSGGSRFQVCTSCGAWSGLARIATESAGEGSFVLVERQYTKRGCECT